MKDKSEYNTAKYTAKKIIVNAREVARTKFGEEFDKKDKIGNVFKMAKQVRKTKSDVVGTGCVKDQNGKIVVDEEDTRKVWKEHYEKLLNEELAWDKNGLG